MNRTRSTVVLSFVVVWAAVLTLSGPVSAGLLSRPLFQSGGTPQVVSYQGQVTVDGIAYTGIGYFKFAVVDQAGTTTAWSNDGTSTAGSEPTAAVMLTVTNGLFNVLLGDTTLANMTALPASAFSEPNRTLRVWFSSNGSTFTLLTPDRRIAAVPYALQAEEAKSAADADTVDGLHASAFQQHAANVVVVAKSGGDFASVTDALNSITTASDANRYLVKVLPGIYTETVTMKPYVDIEGSGELTTRLTFPGSASTNTGTVIGANEAELRRLTVENTGGLTNSIAISVARTSPRLTQVTAIASGGTYYEYGLYLDHASPLLTNMVISTTGGSSAYGVYVKGSSPTLQNVTLQNVTINVSGSSYTSCGVYSWASTVALTGVTINASNGSFNWGVRNAAASMTIYNSIIRASGGTESIGLLNFISSGSYNTTVNDSQIAGSTYAIKNGIGFTSKVGATLLEGGGVTTTGTITCAGVYDENYAFYANTCP